MIDTRLQQLVMIRDRNLKSSCIFCKIFFIAISLIFEIMVIDIYAVFVL